LRALLAEEFQAGDYAWAYEDPVIDTEKIIWKDATRSDTAQRLRHVHSLLQSIDAHIWNPATIKACMWNYAEQEGRGAVLWPLRYALTGKEKSPDPFTVAAVVGKECALERIDTAIKRLDNI
jgi:glutamyl/glutaminyl-tRNA synthetase